MNSTGRAMKALKKANSKAEMAMDLEKRPRLPQRSMQNDNLIRNKAFSFIVQFPSCVNQRSSIGLYQIHIASSCRIMSFLSMIDANVVTYPYTYWNNGTCLGGSIL
jgi:hypothetical protein